MSGQPETGRVTWRPFSSRDHDFAGLLVERDAEPQCVYNGIGCDEGRCTGAVHVTPVEGRPVWTIVQLDPLTLSPSIQCVCGGFHGHIRDGKWEAA